MSKTKVDPAMCMKTKGSHDKITNYKSACLSDILVAFAYLSSVLSDI